MTIFRPIAVFLTAGALLAGCASEEPSAAEANAAIASYESMMHVADASKLAGDFTAAANLYARASHISPDRPEPYRGLGEAFLGLGKPEEAIKAYQAGIAVAANDPELRLGLGKAYFAIGRADLAISALKEAQTLEPANPRILAMLGLASDAVGDHTAAQSYYRNALSIDPADGGIANNLALSLALTGDYAQATAILKPIADDQKSTSRQRQTLSLIYGLAGNRDAAHAYARRDLGDAAIENNLAYFASLRAMSPDERTKALANMFGTIGGQAVPATGPN